MLNDFSAVNINQSAAAAASTTAAGSSSQQASGAGAEEPVLSEEEFARQLQAGMAELLGELERSVWRTDSTPTQALDLTKPQPEVQAQFESIFRELGAAASASAEELVKNPPPSAAPAAGSSGSRPSTSSGPSPADAASFQETIRKTIERMQQSGEQATAAAAAEGAGDFLTELLKQMQSGALDGEGGEEEFSKMLLGMMEQLTNKEILYEPMKELHEKFPEWIEKNRGKVSAEDLKRYEEQQTYVREIVAKFEEPTYSDENKADREYIIDRMQKVSLLV